MAVVAEGLKIDKTFKMPARAKIYARSPAPVKAIQVSTEFCLETSEGLKEGKPGDYLVLQNNGEFKMMEKTEFEKEYEVISIGGRG